MSLDEKKTVISRREFLKDAGLVVGGATVGSMTFLSACGKTTTVTGSGTTTTQTVSKFIDPIDGSECATLDALKAHFNAVRPMAEISATFTTLNVNGIDYSLQVDDMDTLIWTLREKLGLFGTKLGCDAGKCGACTVLVD